MVRNEHRVAKVRALRARGRECGVPLAEPFAGKAKVDAMMTAIRGSSAATEIKAKAEIDYKLYLATYEGADGEGEQQPKPGGAKQRKSFKLRGTSFLFTWNWSLCKQALPDGIGC